MITAACQCNQAPPGAGPIAELRAWLDVETAITGGGNYSAVSVAKLKAKLDKIEGPAGESREARVAEAKRVLEWTYRQKGLIGGLFGEPYLTEDAEAYVTQAGQEKEAKG